MTAGSRKRRSAGEGGAYPYMTRAGLRYQVKGPVRMPDGSVTDFPETMPAADIQKEITQKFPDAFAKPHAAKPVFPYVRSDVSWDLTLTSEESAGVHVGVVHPVEKVTLLYSDSYSSKVKTKNGMVGWADAGNFEAVQPERFTTTSDVDETK